MQEKLIFLSHFEYYCSIKLSVEIDNEDDELEKCMTHKLVRFIDWIFNKILWLIRKMTSLIKNNKKGFLLPKCTPKIPGKQISTYFWKQTFFILSSYWFSSIFHPFYWCRKFRRKLVEQKVDNIMCNFSINC